MPVVKALLLALLSLLLPHPHAAIRWHEGCMCELTSERESEAGGEAGGAAAALSQSRRIFGTTHFRHNGAIATFCPCSLSSVQSLNAAHVSPALGALLGTPFFRYFRVDLEAECPFWKNDGYCTIKQCSVDEAEEEQTAAALGTADTARGQGHDQIDEHWETHNELDASWTNEQENEDFHYVDLLANKEQYTGYTPAAGSSRVWHEIHAYNTFHSSEAKIGHVGEEGEETLEELATMPVEHRLFWKSVSGLHASISSHIAVNYLLDRKSDTWGLDLDEFRRRLTDHPDRINNLHFVYLLELRAASILGDHLVRTDHPLATGHPDEDAHTVGLMRDLIAGKDNWPICFEEETAFHGDTNHHLLERFRGKMYNISRIMDCVGCQRCRLWGKLQMIGLGTALRILYSPHRGEVLRSLHRSHIVALFNALGRLSHSVEATRIVLPLLAQVETGVLGREDARFAGEPVEEEGGEADHHQHHDHHFSFDKEELAQRSGVFGL